MKDHKPNRRRRRAMQRIGDRIAKRIIKQNLITKTQRDVTKEETHQGNTEVPGDANDRQRELVDSSKPVRMDTGDSTSDNQQRTPDQEVSEKAASNKDVDE